MTPAEIRSIREHLGLSQEEFADVLNIDVRSVRRWETGQQDIHAGNAAAIRKIVDITATNVRQLVIELRGQPHPTLVTYQSDADMWAHRPALVPFPARWHRIIAARVAELVPNLTITYSDRSVPRTDGPVIP